MSSNLKVACLGGGHGLFQTLRASRLLDTESITAVVTVADDGGSSGRLRREFRGLIPPGDLRMALAALAGDDERSQMWASTLQHRFGGTGALAGHAVGNLLIAGLTESLGTEQAALDEIATLMNTRGRVVPMAGEPLDIEAEVAGLDDDPRVMRAVRGQVSVATTPGQVRRVRLIPDDVDANPLAIEAIRNADLVTLGPGSWFSSVIPHLLIPSIVEAIAQSSAQRVVVLNLTPEPGETAGFSAERHLHMLRQHAPELQMDWVLMDESTMPSASEQHYLARAAELFGAKLAVAGLREVDDRGRAVGRHDPAKLSAAFQRLAGER